jgi:integrase
MPAFCPELAAGIRRVKGVRQIGVRQGNWLTPEQGRRLPERVEPPTARRLRDHAMVAMLIGCGLRRPELLDLRLESIQQREEHWVIADLIGKAGPVRTVPSSYVGENGRGCVDHSSLDNEQSGLSRHQ